MSKSLLLAFVIASTGAAASAATINVLSGSAEVIATPSEISNDALFSQDGVLTALNEATGVTLTEDLKVGKEGGNLVTIAAGTVVDSHLIFYNPLQATIGTVTASFGFDSDILNVIRLPGWLNASHDVLGAPGTTYGSLDGGEFGSWSQDDVTINSPFSLTITSMVEVENDNEFGDWFRVITLSQTQPANPQFEDQEEELAPVPLPASGLLLGLAILGGGWAARRRK